MTYKDCLVTTVKYTITQDSYEAMSAKQEQYDSNGIATQLEDIDVTPEGISAMLEDIYFYQESILEDLEDEEPGVEKTVIFYHPEEEDEEGTTQVFTLKNREGTIQVTTLKNGETLTHAVHEVITESVEEIIWSMLVASCE